MEEQRAKASARSGIEIVELPKILWHARHTLHFWLSFNRKGSADLSRYASSDTFRVSGKKINPMADAIAKRPTGYHIPEIALPAFMLSKEIMKGDMPPIHPALRLCGNATAV